MKKTLRSLICICLIFALCATVIKPTVFSDFFSRETRVHTAWKKEAETYGNVCSFEDELYYTETDEKNIVQLTNSVGYVNNEVIVYFNEDTTAAQKQALLDTFSAKVIGHTDLLNKYQLQIEQNDFVGLQKLCKTIKKQPHVQYAHCNMALQRNEDTIPNDPWLDANGYKTAYSWDESDFYGGNWWLTATQTISAWDASDYFHSIQVGILDSGFEVDHEDLQGKIRFPSKFYERRNIPSSHGTHVSGIIAANHNNGIGISGICDKAQLLCVDWQPEHMQLWSTDERIFTGFIALVKSGAKVINLSLGSSGSFKKADAFFWNIGMYFEGLLFSYTVASLLSKGYDFLVVQSAGNGSKEDKPCDSKYNGSFCSITEKNIFTGLTGISKQTVLDHIIIVGSCAPIHENDSFYQSSFSNYGKGVSIFAPGSLVFSTDLQQNGGYSYKSGTSMATPVVTGIAALTWSVNPDLTGDEVKKILCDPQNSCYKCVNYYNEDMSIPEYRMVNAKLSVEAARKTLHEDEPTTETEPENTEPNTTEHESIQDHTITAQNEKTTLSQATKESWIECFRNEIGE